MVNDPIRALQEWYASNCDGDWEHEYGIKIENIDNPGWSVEIPLTGTPLEGRFFADVKVERSAADWLMCRVANDTFRGDGGSRNLGEILDAFLDWARS